MLFDSSDEHGEFFFKCNLDTLILIDHSFKKENFPPDT